MALRRPRSMAVWQRMIVAKLSQRPYVEGCSTVLQRSSLMLAAGRRQSNRPSSTNPKRPTFLT